MRALVLNINQHIKFEVPNFIDSKNMSGVPAFKGHVTMTTPIRG